MKPGLEAARDEARERAFQSVQERHFADADRDRFRWTTEDPGFAGVEDDLIAPWLRELPFPCLEIGCGEGTNLARLVRWGRPVGIDRFPAKARFAAAAIPGARIVTADAVALPFAAGTFAGVLVRDLLHHLSDRRLAVSEAVRVLRPNGMLLVLEPNGRNPIVALQARVVAAERALRRFTPESVLDALAGMALDRVQIAMAQPLPLRRLLLHYHYGFPRLGRPAAARAALAWLERSAEHVLPRRRWSYTVVRARRRPG